jgi:hypothetical protein
MVSTVLSAHDDTSEVSDDLRAWNEQQLIAAAKTGRRVPFGELFERRGEKLFGFVHTGPVLRRQPNWVMRRGPEYLTSTASFYCSLSCSGRTA